MKRERDQLPDTRRSANDEEGTLLNIPEFMSPAHVDRMNLLLAESAAVRDAAAALGGTYTMTFQLDDAPAGTEYWTTIFGPAGMHFELTAPRTPPDVLVRADWTTTMRALHAQKEGREAPAVAEETTGEKALVERLEQVLAIGRRVATIDTRLPPV
ncbi:hypothetical protein ACXIZN_15665 [Amycolatopsis sp. TRM77291]